jgi:hypothetical protein
MTAYKLLVIISYFLRSCFAPTDIFALHRSLHPSVRALPCPTLGAVTFNDWYNIDDRSKKFQLNLNLGL